MRSAVAALLLSSTAFAGPSRAGFAVGEGWLTGHDDTAGSRATASTAFYGREVSRGLDVLFETIMVSGASYSPDPTLSQEISGAFLGARWAPIRIAATTGKMWEPRDVYVQLTVGVTALALTPYTTVFAESQAISFGPAIGGEIGWYPVRFGNARFGFAILDKVGFYNTDSGRRHHIALTTGVEVQL